MALLSKQRHGSQPGWNRALSNTRNSLARLASWFGVFPGVIFPAACDRAACPGFAFLFRLAGSALSIRPWGVLLSPPRSEKTHHVVDLLHVDAFQWECVALLFRDPVALPKQTQAMSHSSIFQENNATTVKLAGSYIADIAGWRPLALRSFWQHSIFIRKQLVPLFLPKTFVYRHNVALCRKNVLVIRPV